MSAFEKGNENPGAEEVITEEFLESLVGDGKKFVDPEALAKGKYEADNYIKGLEKQLSELRSDIESSSKIDELMELVRNQNKEPEGANKNSGNPDPDNTSPGQMSEQELKALIEDHVTERDKQTSLSRSLLEAEKFLEDRFGVNAYTVINDRAKALDMSVEDLKALASTNLKAFYRLIGTDTKQNQESTTLLGGKSTERGDFKGAEVRNSAFYKELRKKDKKAYYHPKVQMQLMKDAEALGEAFYINS